MIAIDTNVLAYAEGVNGERNRDAALQLLAAVRPDVTLLPAQALAELFNVLVRKAKRAPAAAQASVLSWGDAFPVIETSADVIVNALTLSRTHQLGVWDSVILAAAADAGCRVLLSEDLQAGFTWGRLTVVNPFATPHDALLEQYLVS
jgi:predicted nucleic acid-binding protein